MNDFQYRKLNPHENVVRYFPSLFTLFKINCSLIGICVLPSLMIVMEFVEGGTLLELLKGSKMLENFLLFQICKGDIKSNWFSY